MQSRGKEIKIPKRTLKKLESNCNHGGVMYYDKKYRVGKYQLVDSWNEKETGLFVPGYHFMVIKDLETNKYYQNKSTWIYLPYNRLCFNNTKCIRVKKAREEIVKWKI